MVRIKRLLDLLCVAVALCSLAPVLASLDRALLLVVLLVIPAGLWCDHRQRYPLPNWLATLVALAGMAFYAVQITRAEVVIPVVHAMVVLLAVRLLTPKQGRDYLQIFVLALFILAGSSLINLEIGFALYLVLLIFGVTLGLVLLTVHVSDEKLIMTRPDLLKLIKVGLVLPVVSLLLMLVFFVVLPRTREPLWNFLNPSAKAVVGLAETVQPGSFAGIASNRALAFRAEGPELAPEERYWRALVLNRFRDGRWVRSEPPPEGPARIAGPTPVSFTIYPEARSDLYLVSLDRPLQMSGLRHTRTVDQVLLSRRAIDYRFRYEVLSSPGADLQVQGRLNREFYLQVPADVSPRMGEVAAAIRAEHAAGNARLEALAEFFRAQQLSYAQDDLPFGPQAIDDFLFGKKRGYCEFFAAAYVTLARLAGIPARLVGGYFGGEYNGMGGYYLVGEDAAHVWAEVLTDEQVWRRVDPSQWAANADTVLGERGRLALSLWQQLLDNVNYQWVQAVVVFDLDQQVELLRAAGEGLRKVRAPDAPAGWWRIAAGVLAFGLLLCGGLAWRRPSREARLLGALRRRLKKRHGVEALPPGTGLAELGERLDSEACREFARIYYGAVFRDRRLTAQEVAALKGLLKRL